jgi:hypothetical protein
MSLNLTAANTAGEVGLDRIGKFFLELVPVA